MWKKKTHDKDELYDENETMTNKLLNNNLGEKNMSHKSQ